MATRDPEPKRVPEQSYRGLKSKITQSLKQMETLFTEYTQNDSAVTSIEEKDTIYGHLNKANEAIAKFEGYLQQHGLHEAKMQESDASYTDDELAKQMESFPKYQDKVGQYAAKASQFCRDFNKANPTIQRKRQNSRGAPIPSSPNKIIVFRDDEKVRMSETLRPPPLQSNSGILKVQNWEKAVQAYFDINAMAHKSREIQKSAFLACCDDQIQRYLTVKFTNMPDVDIVSDAPDSYIKAVVEMFEQKYPLPIRIFNFFQEVQKGSEDVTSWVRRCESMSIAAKIEDLRYDDIMKYKIITGLSSDDTLRSKLLKNCHIWTLERIKEEIAAYEATQRVANEIDKKLHVSGQVNYVSSYKKDQTEKRQSQYNNFTSFRGRLPLQAAALQRPPYRPRSLPPSAFRQRGLSLPTQESPNLGCRKTLHDGRKCGFVPYFKCRKHNPKSFIRNSSNAVQEASNDATNIEVSVDNESDDELNTGFVNSVNAVHEANLIQTVGNHHYLRDLNGQPIMENIVSTPLIYVYLKYDPSTTRRRGRYHTVHTTPYEVLAMPDSGCTRCLISERLAHACDLTIDRSQNTQMYAANRQPMNCIGGTRAVVSYFGKVISIKLYVMEEISTEYIMLSRRACQALQILPKDYPLPLQKCDFSILEDPPIHNDPFHNLGLHQYNPNFHEDNVLHTFDAGPPSQLYNPRPQRTVPCPSTVPSSGPTLLHGDRDSTPPGQLLGGSKSETGGSKNESSVNIIASFNDEREKSDGISKLNKLIHKYSRVFDTSIKKNIKVPKVRLRFKKNVPIVPFKCTSSKPIPYALRQAARKEIDEQIQLGILARVPPEADIEWCSRGMILEKPNGGRDVRLVVDSKEINEVLDRDAFPMQSTKELVKQIPPKSRFFLSVDFYKGYYQIPLAEEDQLKTTFMLHSMGLFYFKRLPQGGKCSVDQFNRITDELILDIPNCLKMVDDVMIHGQTIDEVLNGFTKLLDKCIEKDFTLHPKKLSFGNKLKFAGYVISDKGIEIDPKKVEAIRKFEPPQNVTDMKAFIGVAVQFQEACPNLMGVLKPLIETTSYKNTPATDEKGKKIKNPKRLISWNKNLEEAFFQAKKLLTDSNGTVLTPYDPSLPLLIYTDASRLNGLGWIALQEVNGVKKLIECGSCTIPDSAKRNFSVSELELAAVEMALKKMRLMTLGNKNIVIKTDHLPLLGILKKPLEKIETKRLMKLAEKLQTYEFTLEYVKGVKNEVADALSRHPTTKHGEADIEISNHLMVNVIDEFEGTDSCSLKDIRKIAALDKDYQETLQAILNGVDARNLPPDHPGRLYKADWNLLAVDQDLITLGERIIIPKGARKDILKLLHVAHLGKRKTLALASNLYYWKNMVKDITELIDNCEECQVHSNFLQKETLKQTFAAGPMDMNSADLAEHGKKQYLIHADRFSNFLWIYPLKKTTTDDVTKALWNTFYQVGFPKHLRTDNGPQFISDAFIRSCESFNIEQEWSDPYYPTSNGHAEKMVAVAKNMIKKASNLDELQKMVQVYNATPSSETQVSPAEMLLRRKIRTCLPMVASSKFVPISVVEQAAEKRRENAIKKKQHYDKSAKDLPPISIGQLVRVYNHKTSKWDIKGTIVKRDMKTGRSYRIFTTNDVYIFRNRRFIKPIYSSFDPNYQNSEGTCSTVEISPAYYNM